jgi:hypothetical protein
MLGRDRFINYLTARRYRSQSAIQCSSASGSTIARVRACVSCLAAEPKYVTRAAAGAGFAELAAHLLAER